jgi:hypothetical protein
MEAGGIAVVFVSMILTADYVEAFSGVKEECILTRLLDKCKEEGCMNIKEYHNSKERYFKYCIKRKLCPYNLGPGILLTKWTDKCIQPECENVKAGLRQQCIARMTVLSIDFVCTDKTFQIRVHVTPATI